MKSLKSAILILVISTGLTACDYSSEIETLRQTVDKLGEDVKASTRTASLSINQFGIYIDEYHSSDPQKRAEARRIIHAVFGEIPDNATVDVEFTVTVQKASNGLPLDVDITFIDLKAITTEELASALHRGYGFNPVTLSAFPSQNQASVEAVKHRIDHLINQYINFRRDLLPKCWPNRQAPTASIQFDRESQFYKELMDCYANEKENALAGAIKALIDPMEAVPARNSVSRDYRGGLFAVVLIPKDQLQRQSDLIISGLHHFRGDPNRRLEGFEEQAFKINIEQMLEQSGLKIEGDPRTFAWAQVPLKVGDQIFTIVESSKNQIRKVQ
ncbi:hypothetical protein [Alteromonas naphthalenivorans]|jgi:hypothetical protein|uniref:Lipoprotein n=1 Tax=Alteromonas naphthalenivorans TaxID=715451 RepID=F5ZAE2_ALTNA|nr:hypothetical protein [Alteromonas naphthalenivorans]AEF01912.1 hypothetical protein ambt_01790 [Alteromonas naphthalenivorans]